jgi:hypothetical protein
MPHVFPWRQAFLAALREVPVIRHACDAVGIDRSTAWRARQDDKDFADACDDAMEAGIDRAECEAFRRGVVGFEEPVIHQGMMTLRYQTDAVGRVKLDENGRALPMLDVNGLPVPLTVRKHSDALLTLVLKGRRKKVYAERTELTGADGGPMVVDETVRAARAAQLLELAKRRREAEDLG